MNYKRLLTHLVNIISISFVVGTCIVFFYVFIRAYSNPDKKEVININSKGEAEYEMWLMTPITILSLIYVAYRTLLPTAKELKKMIK